MKRLLTAAVLIPIVLASMFAGPSWIFLALVAVVSTLCYIELSEMTGAPRSACVLGVLAGLVILVTPRGIWFTPILTALAALALPMLCADLTAGFRWSAFLYLGVIYIFDSMRAGYLLGLQNRWWLLLALAINWIGDSGAYYVGRSLGRHKMVPRISPGKSWEGAAASVVFSVLFASLAAPRLLAISSGEGALVGLVGNIAGQFGDLAESAFKRAMGVKDSGRLLPGHGGMLDRMDSALFTLPVVYLLVRTLGL